MSRRLLLPLLTSVVAILVLEGTLSLLGGPRIAARIRAEGVESGEREAGRSGGARGAEPTASQAGGAEPKDGLYAVHPDPRVAYRFRASSNLELVGAPFRTNTLGFRAWHGEVVPPQRVDLLVLGDSVAFGYGVEDDQTLAAQLETELNAVLHEDALPIVGSTLAVPSWNHRQASAALQDHWDTYAPDLVVYMPISNDLGSANGLDERGRQRAAPDMLESDPWLLVSRSFSAWVRDRERELTAEGLEVASQGPSVVEADLTAESARRYDENVASILEMKAFVEARGARFAVFLNGFSPYVIHLSARLARVEDPPKLVFGQRMTEKEMTLEFDSHPNATTLRWRAVWLAAELLDHGWFDAPAGAAAQLPEAPEDYTDLRFDPREGDGLEAYDEQYRALASEQMQSRVSLVDFVGVHQIFGGLNLDGSARFGMSLALRAATREISIELRGLAERSDLAPFEVAVWVGAQRVGAVRIEAEGVSVGRFDLPADIALGEDFDLHLRPERWGVRRSSVGDQVASFEFLSAASD